MKKIFTLTLLSVAVLAGCNSTNTSSPVSALNDKLIVSPNDNRAYDTLKLDNGIEVLLVSDPSVEKSAAALSVGVGLLHDPMTQQGMAHYLEHMLFLGTDKYPDSKGYSEFMTKNGGEHNAYTWLDITNYMFKINNNAYDEGLDRFADFFKSPKLYPEYSEKEKHAVNAEWSMRREMDFFGQFKLARNLMGAHPANRFLIGNLETLGDKEGSSLHQETVAFYDRYYSSNIMKVAMISNRPLTEMAELAKRHFAEIKNKQIADPVVTQQLDFAAAAKKRVFYKPNEDVKQIKLDFTIANNMAEFANKPNYFVSYLLSNEMQGSPAQVLKAAGWISNLTANAEPAMYGNYGTLAVDIELTDLGMQHREAIVATVMQYIELIKRQGVDSKYFKEIKTALDNQFKFLEKGDEFNYVSQLAQSMQDYPLSHAINAPYHFAEFDAKSVNKVLAQLNADALRIWYISQHEETDSKLHFYDGEYRIAAIEADEITSWQAPSQFALQLPTVNRLLPENFTIKAQLANNTDKPALVIDKPALKIWHLPSQQFNHQPKGSLEIAINTPYAKTDVNAAVLYAVWADLYNLQQSKLSTEASVAGVPFALTAGNGLTLSMSGFTDKQTVLLQEALAALKVKTDEQSFQQALQRQRQAIFNQGQQFPYYQAFNKLATLLSDGGFDKQSVLAALDKVTLAEFAQLQDKTLSANQTRVFSFGNYDLADLKQVAKLLEKHLKVQQATPYTKRGFWLPEASQTLQWQEDLDVADVAVIDLLVHPMPGYQSKAAAMVLQGHFRTAVFEKLRTEEQLAYAVGASARSIGEYSALALFIQTPVKSAVDMQTRFDTYKLEYAKELEQLDNTTFEQLKAAALVTLTEQPKNLADEVAPYITDWYKENFEYDSKAKMIAAVEQVTLADLKAYYQQTMLNANAARMNVQLRGEKFQQQGFATLPDALKLNSIAELRSVVKTQQ
ncbi:insulinase family protein [Pseudoalteromonas fenneropenaei]|uniref:Protease 3 n=1 Tax=Pseudoalteromonas fenneropenaei TaxID=1737459 RepID=A0ABV7CMV4_9GAMM